MAHTDEITFKGMSLGEVLANSRLNIPNYQRPYSWKAKNVRNLFYDIKEAKQKENYHLGTLILHENDKTIDIVDGQQRLISIALFLKVMERSTGEKYLGAQHLLEQEYSEQSCQHAKENFEEWQRLIESEGKDKAEKILEFLLKKCEVSVITMPKDHLAEAFQLFDSQNNRGKSLEPHDLLKAYHLRSISSPEENDIKSWEKAVSDEQLPLKELFNQYLFRMRRWSHGETGLTKVNNKSYLRFTEAYIDDFKGNDLSKDYPYLSLYKTLEEKNIDFPKSLLMPIINGKTFFDYIAYAHKKVKKYQVQQSGKNSETTLDSLLNSCGVDDKVLAILTSKKSRYNRNRNLFENLLMLYVDRFGESKVKADKSVLELIYVWAYYPRIKMSAIYDATQANYAVGKKISNHSNFQNVFQLLEQSSTPEEFKMNFDHEIFENISIQDIYEKEESKK
ncbi:DUF262 domain-containing protein [Streptococcus equinus]|uniref:DUF262 domain-containing protein n=1 Tax=Streptococcus equinus TaxID=1335 RepID=UPI0008BEF783|nr:DUF262 domain-containing protein [Streptococcus equinus]SEK40642.1 Uncharacterized conserved protein, contains ParB-like and HNH nuclease domains [Streptococcus equinus]